MGETLHLTATDYEGWVESISPGTTSPLDKYSFVKVRILAPNDVKIGHETTVTVTARNNQLNRIESVKFVLAVGQTENPEVRKMLVDSNIQNRFGRTIVQSRIENVTKMIRFFGGLLRLEKFLGLANENLFEVRKFLEVSLLKFFEVRNFFGVC